LPWFWRVSDTMGADTTCQSTSVLSCACGVARHLGRPLFASNLFACSALLNPVARPFDYRPKEASLGQLLEHTGIDVQAGGEKTPSEFLNSVDPNHQQLAEVRTKIKSVIYDITVPLTTREPREGEAHGVEYNFVSRCAPDLRMQSLFFSAPCTARRSKKHGQESGIRTRERDVHRHGRVARRT
jgi:hypothetical protein